MSISTRHWVWPGGGEGAGMTCGPIDTTFEVVDRVPDCTWLHGACLTESTWNSLGRHSKGTCPVINAQQTWITRQCAGHMDTWRSQVSAYSLTWNWVEKNNHWARRALWSKITHVIFKYILKWRPTAPCVLVCISVYTTLKFFTTAPGTIKCMQVSVLQSHSVWCHIVSITNHVQNLDSERACTFGRTFSEKPIGWTNQNSQMLYMHELYMHELLVCQNGNTEYTVSMTIVFPSR